MRYFNKEVNVNSVEEFNKHCMYVSKYCYEIFYEKYDGQPIADVAYFEETDTLYKLTYKKDKKITYVFNRNGEVLSEITVPQAVSRMSRQFKIQRIEDVMDIYKDVDIALDSKPYNYRETIGSASPLRFCDNNRFGGKTVKAWEYDLSCAYGQMLKLPLPDITTCKTDCRVLEGQIGFIVGEPLAVGNKLKMVDGDERPGLRCDWVFDKMESPYIEWVNKIRAQIRREKDKVKKNDLKNLFRFSVGQLQNLNPFWRATIVERCNHLIKKYKDENTIYCNTDSIVSCVKRPDIEALAEFEFALKRDGEDFTLDKTTMIHQWNEEIPVMPGPQLCRIKYYNMTHDTPWKLGVNEIPTDKGSLYVAVKGTNSIRVELNKEILNG